MLQLFGSIEAGQPDPVYGRHHRLAQSMSLGSLAKMTGVMQNPDGPHAVLTGRGLCPKGPTVKSDEEQLHAWAQAHSECLQTLRKNSTSSIYA